MNEEACPSHGLVCACIARAFTRKLRRLNRLVEVGALFRVETTRKIPTGDHYDDGKVGWSTLLERCIIIMIVMMVDGRDEKKRTTCERVTCRIGPLE
jgi:hypothetical protein